MAPADRELAAGPGSVSAAARSAAYPGFRRAPEPCPARHRSIPLFAAEGLDRDWAAPARRYGCSYCTVVAKQVPSRGRLRRAVAADYRCAVMRALFARPSERPLRRAAGQDIPLSI